MNYKFIIFFLLISLLGGVSLKAKNVLNQDSIIYEKYIKEFVNKKNENVNDLVIKTALYFLNRPYVASTLEANDNEKLVVNLREFDCMTFVENCIALSGTIKSGDYSFQNYQQMLQLIRYRKGKINGYTSRLHYTSDWIINNTGKGIFENVSQVVGGEIIDKKINFMSEHPQSYEKLKTSPENVEKMKEIEKKIEAQKSYTIIPKSKIRNAISQIGNGDIVVFATSINGLDYSHIGIAYYDKGKLTFIHASSKLMKICVEPKGLEKYCMDSPTCTGISVLQLNN